MLRCFPFRPSSGAEADRLRATNGPAGGGFNFTKSGGTIELSNFTGGNLTTYLEGKASAGLFKIDGTTVSSFGSSIAINDRYLAPTDNGTSGALTLTTLAPDDYMLWAMIHIGNLFGKVGLLRFQVAEGIGNAEKSNRADESSDTGNSRNLRTVRMGIRHGGCSAGIFRPDLVFPSRWRVSGYNLS